MNCPFCDKDVLEFKSNSHVIPKWMYKLTFERNKNFSSVDLKDKNVKKVQDGYKSSFICADCEDLFEKDDTYASLVFVMGRNRKNIKGISDAKNINLRTSKGAVPGLVLDGIDFKKVQKFVFGVFLRGYLAGVNRFNPILGQKHFEEVRRVYFDENNLSDSDYPVFISKVPADDKLIGVVSLPTRGKNRNLGVNVLHFMGGGFEFQMIVQNHFVRDELMIIRLRNTGELVIPIIKPAITQSAEVALNAAREIVKSKRAVRNQSKTMGSGQ